MTAFYATAEYGTTEAPGVPIDFSCDAASFAASGKPVSLARAMVMAAAAFALAAMPMLGAGSIVCGATGFVLSGKAIAAPITMHNGAAAFSLVGKTAGAGMPTPPVAFVVSGQATGGVIAQAISKVSYVFAGGSVLAAMPVSRATFTLGGVDAQGVAAAGLAPAAYVLFGKPVFQTWHIGLDLPGEPATAEYGTAEYPQRQIYQIVTGEASYGLTTQSAIMTTGPEAGRFQLFGGQANQAIGVDPAALALYGQGVLFDYSAVAGRGGFALAPQLLQSLLPLDPGAFHLAGQEALLRISLERAVFALTGQQAYSVKWLGVGPGHFVLAGQTSSSNIAQALSRASFNLLGWSIADIIGPSGAHEYLIEVQAHDGVSLKTFYLSSSGFISQPSDTPSNQYYDPRIIDPGNFDRALFDGTDLRGRAKSGSGDIVVANGDPGNGQTLDAWFTYGWSQRDIRILSLPQGSKSLSAASTLFVGKLNTISSTAPLDTINLKIADRLGDLEQPLLTELYAGTTLSSGPTAEGNADLMGKIKQQCWGSCSNVPLQAANPFDLIYVVSRSVVASISVYDGGAALTYDGDSANINALQSSVISGGHYRTCLAAGLVRVGALPEKSLTADVVEGAVPSDRTAGQIVYRMLIQYGVPSGAISTGSIAVLDGLNAAECCYFVDDDREIIAAVQDVLDSVGGWMVPDRDGTLVFGRYSAPSTAPQSTFDLDAVAIGTSLDMVDNDLPAWRVINQYAPVFTVQNDNDLLGAVSAERRAYLAKQYRTTAAEDSSVQTKHLSAREVTITTYLVDATAAATEAARQLGLLSAERQRYTITMPLTDAWPSVPGNSITLRHPRLGLSDGKPFNVLERVDQYQTDTVEFSLWG